MNKVKDENYHKAITVKTTAMEAFKSISNIAGWWNPAFLQFEGNTANLNDVFRVSWGGKTWVSFKVIESVPEKRLVWLVTDCYLDFVKDEKEWKDTKVVWDISADEDGIRIEMTHVGLVPGVECYNECSSGWNKHIGNELLKLAERGS
jgi:alpha-amylase/alpha-mannosidase (GH57 family)